MGNSIGYIFTARCPSQMLWVNTARVSIPAAVRRFRFIDRSRTIPVFAHNLMHKNGGSLNGGLAVTMGMSAIRPEQAIVSRIVFMRFNPSQMITSVRLNADTKRLKPAWRPLSFLGTHFAILRL